MQDLSNADCIVIQGSNMAECHPVAYQWVTEARLKGAKVIHIDPRFTRTSATADKHIPIRAGSDVVLPRRPDQPHPQQRAVLQGLRRRLHQRGDARQRGVPDTEDLDGLFSGYDEETGSYDPKTLGLRHRGRRATSPGTIGGPAAAHEHGDSKSERAAGDEHGSGGPALEHARVLRDETLQDPRTVFQILKRHYARYTPEMVAGRVRHLASTTSTTSRGR